MFKRWLDSFASLNFIDISNNSYIYYEYFKI